MSIPGHSPQFPEREKAVGLLPRNTTTSRRKYHGLIWLHQAKGRQEHSRSRSSPTPWFTPANASASAVAQDISERRHLSNKLRRVPENDVNATWPGGCRPRTLNNLLMVIHRGQAHGTTIKRFAALGITSRARSADRPLRRPCRCSNPSVARIQPHAGPAAASGSI